MSPLGEIASPSQPSATGTLPVTRPEEVSITLIEGGLYPPLSTSRYLPSGVSAVDMGSVSSGTWRPTGSRRQPLLSRKAPPGSPAWRRGRGRRRPGRCDISANPKGESWAPLIVREVERNLALRDYGKAAQIGRASCR